MGQQGAIGAAKGSWRLAAGGWRRDLGGKLPARYPTQKPSFDIGILVDKLGGCLRHHVGAGDLIAVDWHATDCHSG